jgi:hypothetical protein
MLFRLEGPVDPHDRAKETGSQKNQNMEYRDIQRTASLFVPIELQSTLFTGYPCFQWMSSF